jgi:hypothetical protein
MFMQTHADPNHRRKLWLLAAIILVTVVAALLVPPVPQNPEYHSFADQRTLFSMPNFWNVISNLPFVPVGIVGVLLLSRQSVPGGLASQRAGYAVFFLGAVLIGLGSGYYHLQPTNYSLVWDRLPMTLAFMAFVAVIVGENIDETAGRRALLPLLALGVLSVGYWYYTELQGRGDLRLYALVQFLPMLLLPLTLWLFRSAFISNLWVWLAMLCYGAAKIVEAADLPVYEVLGISGHSIKHVLAALGVLAFYMALCRRRNKPAIS